MLETTANTQVYTVTSGGSVFTFNVPFFDAEDIHCYLRVSGGSDEVELVNGTDFTVQQLADYSSGADVTLAPSRVASGGTLVIAREVAPTQKLSLPTNGKLPAKAMERAFDRMAAAIMQNREALNRTVGIPITDLRTSGGKLTELYLSYIDSAYYWSEQAKNRAFAASNYADQAASHAAEASVVGSAAGRAATLEIFNASGGVMLSHGLTVSGGAVVHGGITIDGATAATQPWVLNRIGSGFLPSKGGFEAYGVGATSSSTSGGTIVISGSTPKVTFDRGWLFSSSFEGDTVFGVHGGGWFMNELWDPGFLVARRSPYDSTGQFPYIFVGNDVAKLGLLRGGADVWGGDVTVTPQKTELYFRQQPDGDVEHYHENEVSLTLSNGWATISGFTTNHGSGGHNSSGRLATEEYVNTHAASGAIVSGAEIDTTVGGYRLTYTASGGLVVSGSGASVVLSGGQITAGAGNYDGGGVIINSQGVTLQDAAMGVYLSVADGDITGPDGALADRNWVSATFVQQLVTSTSDAPSALIDVLSGGTSFVYTEPLYSLEVVSVVKTTEASYIHFTLGAVTAPTPVVISGVSYLNSATFEGGKEYLVGFFDGMAVVNEVTQ